MLKNKLKGKLKNKLEVPPKSQPATPAKPEVSKGKHVCATCGSCDVRNCGYCNNMKVRECLSMWDGIILDVNAFGCNHWKEKTNG